MKTVDFFRKEISKILAEGQEERDGRGPASSSRKWKQSKVLYRVVTSVVFRVLLF